MQARGSNMKRTMLEWLALVGLLIGGAAAQATPITYIWSGIGSGSVGALPFTDVGFTITAAADTTEVGPGNVPGIHRVFNATATVFVSGIGAATFTIPTLSVANQNLPAVGISDPVQNLAILFANRDPAFATYDLTTALGPITAQPTFNPRAFFQTDLGSFQLAAVSGAVTFEAQVTGVPEPGVVALLILGVAVLGFSRRHETS
jgi:hypothetical protein